MFDFFYYEIWFDGFCIECSADNNYYFETEDEAYDEASWAVLGWTDEEGYQDCDTSDFMIDVLSTTTRIN